MKNRRKFIGILIIITSLFYIFGAASDVRAGDVLLPKGTRITLQLNDTLSTASNMEGDEFTAVVATPVYIDDLVAISKGSVVTGRVSRILRSNRFKGKAVLDLMFQSIRVQGREQADIDATLIRVDAGSGGTTENFTGVAAKSGNSGQSKIGQQPLNGKNTGIGASGGFPSVFNSQGEDVIIPRGASMDITLDRSLTLTEEIKRPARK